MLLGMYLSTIIILHNQHRRVVNYAFGSEAEHFRSRVQIKYHVSYKLILCSRVIQWKRLCRTFTYSVHSHGFLSRSSRSNSTSPTKVDKLFCVQFRPPARVSNNLQPTQGTHKQTKQLIFCKRKKKKDKKENERGLFRRNLKYQQIVSLANVQPLLHLQLVVTTP